MREWVERVTNEAELPYKPKGWRNLYLILVSYTSQTGRYYAEGSMVYGYLLHPSKEAAIANLRAQDNTGYARGYCEWLGAFEVEE